MLDVFQRTVLLIEKKTDKI